jgi:hypothetical protein
LFRRITSEIGTGFYHLSFNWEENEENLAMTGTMRIRARRRMK